MLKPEPRFLSSPGIIGVYTAGAKMLVGILNASCWLVHSAAPSCPTCFWPARSFAEEAKSHDEIGTWEYTGIMLSHTWVTEQGWLHRGPIKKLSPAVQWHHPDTTEQESVGLVLSWSASSGTKNHRGEEGEHQCKHETEGHPCNGGSSHQTCGLRR